MQPPAYSSISDKKIDRISLRGAALPDPDHPFLISPLPQFTTPLTTTSSFFSTPANVPPLPELTDDLEDDEDDDEAAESGSEHEATTPIVVQQDLRDSNGIRRRSFLQTDGRSEHNSALARTGPYLDHRRARSGSTPEMYSSPSSSVNISADTSNASPRSPPKSATPSQSQQQQVQQHAFSSSSRESDASSFPTRSTSSRNPDGGVLRTRLHDLLRDSALSSSLPNMSASHFPASFTNRETSSGSVSPHPPPRSDSSNTNKTPLPPPSSSSSDTPVPLLPQTTGSGKPLSGVAPFCNFAPRQGFSSASTEAKKLEEERKRKLIEEKQQQQSSMDHTMSKQPSSSTSTTQSSNNSNNTATIQLTPRREQQSSTITNSGPIPTTRRGQSFTGSLGRSGSSMVSPSKEEQYDTFSSSSSNSGSTSSSLSPIARRGQSYTGSLGRSGSSTVVSPTSKEEQQQQQQQQLDTFTHQARYHVSIGKARGTIISSSVDSAGIYA